LVPFSDLRALVVGMGAHCTIPAEKAREAIRRESFIVEKNLLDLS